VSGCKSGNQVVFACAYGTLGGIGPMSRGGDMLVSDVALHKENRELGRGLVVEFEVSDRKAMRSEEGEDRFEGGT
jgi:hypothetical protein